MSSLLLVFDSPSPGCLACVHTAHMGLIKSLNPGRFLLALLGHGEELLICKDTQVSPGLHLAVAILVLAETLQYWPSIGEFREQTWLNSSGTSLAELWAASL